MFEIPAYYEYCCRVKILAGHDALEKIPDLLAGLGASRPLIVSDKGVSGAGLVARMYKCASFTYASPFQ